MLQNSTHNRGRMNAAEAVLGPPLAAGLGDMLALICGERRLSYAELDRLVNRYGNALLAAGIEPENRVLFFMDDAPDLVAAYLATIKIGAVAVAFNVRATAEDLRFVIEQSRCKVLFIDAEFENVHRAIETRLTHPPLVIVACARDRRELTPQLFIDGQADTLDYRPMARDDMAFWIYTSGTTGRPKAVVHAQHDVLLADLHLKENLGLKPGERVFTTSKIFFAFALGHSILGGLRGGATVILHQGWPDPGAIIREVERSQPDLFCSVPSFYRNLLRYGAAENMAFRRIRYCVSSGERLPEALFQRWKEATGVPLLEGVGTSETIFLFLANTPHACRPGAAGRALPWSELRLLDAAGCDIRQPGIQGILWVRMDSVFDRYWNQQAQTRAVFQDGFYCTRDVFWFDDDGYWHHGGRADDMLKISGQWVSPAEIEECVLAVPGVAEAVVVGEENADGLVRAALFVTPADDCETAALEQTIRTTLTSRLSIYKCPRTIRFVDEIPRTSSGKIQRFKLRGYLGSRRIAAN